jgi:hypothetical protein
VNPALSFVTGLNSYHDEMDSLSGRPERWPDRQRLAGSIKTAHVATLGVSKEFNRLVDLDLRRREFLITLREQSVNEQRAKEMKVELGQIEEQIASLKASLKAQAARNELSRTPQVSRVESIATVGLFNLAIDAFSAGSPDSARSTQVGPYVVSDDGGATTVTGPDGEIFHCSTQLIADVGTAMTCTPLNSRAR